MSHKLNRFFEAKVGQTVSCKIKTDCGVIKEYDLMVVVAYVDAVGFYVTSRAGSVRTDFGTFNIPLIHATHTLEQVMLFTVQRVDREFFEKYPQAQLDIKR